MKITDVLLATVVALCWGFNFVVIKIGLDSFPPILFSALRFTCAAFPAILIWGRDGIEWRWIISIGLILGTVMFTLLFIGMHLGMPAGLSSIVLQVQVVFTLILSGLILRDRPSVWQKVGITIAFAGIGLLILDKYETAGFVGMLFVVGSGLAWAIANIMMKQCGNIDMFRLMIWMSLIPPIPLVLVSLIFEEGQAQALANISLTGWGAIFYTGLISTVLAYSLWGKLLQRYSPNVVAPFALLVPVFGILSSVVVLNESLSVFELIASCLVLAGLFVVVYGVRISEFVAARLNLR